MKRQKPIFEKDWADEFTPRDKKEARRTERNKYKCLIQRELENNNLRSSNR